ncbi:hypothetical protein N480_06730 [Pseudoalteromonas luteoviolacea S2607]|uniref:hypothetical protein n=1 Tax=Pseudoalteromonas luteoviolacea TaxID=43657 RepID=UPI0007B06C2E|nr:hypothetical protein [Pseudoalteromonas luteoviolacea]KZN29411.1 hypothetical protein N480_06730 [Pseudoalteromonas luteoviolacea S2607]
MLLKKIKFMQMFENGNTSLIGNLDSSLGVEDQKRKNQKSIRGLSNCQIMMVEGGTGGLGGGQEPPMASQWHK